MSMKIVCLAQVNDAGASPTDTMDFIHAKEVPVDNKITYAHFVAGY